MYCCLHLACLPVVFCSSIHTPLPSSLILTGVHVGKQASEQPLSMPPKKKSPKPKGKGKASEEARCPVEPEGPAVALFSVAAFRLFPLAQLWGGRSTPPPNQDWIEKAKIITMLVWKPKKTAKDPIDAGMTTHQSQEPLGKSSPCPFAQSLPPCPFCTSASCTSASCARSYLCCIVNAMISADCN